MTKNDLISPSSRERGDYSKGSKQALAAVTETITERMRAKRVSIVGLVHLGVRSLQPKVLSILQQRKPIHVPSQEFLRSQGRQGKGLWISCAHKERFPIG